MCAEIARKASHSLVVGAGRPSTPFSPPAPQGVDGRPAPTTTMKRLCHSILAHITFADHDGGGTDHDGRGTSPGGRRTEALSRAKRSVLLIILAPRRRPFGDPGQLVVLGEPGCRIRIGPGEVRLLH